MGDGKESEKPKNPKDKKKSTKPKYIDRKSKNVVHSYFQGHECSMPSEKVFPYEIEYRECRWFIQDLTTAAMHDVRARCMFRSFSALCEEKYRQYKYYPFTIHPFSKLRLAMEVVFSVSTIIFFVLFALLFSSEHPEREDTFIYISMQVMEGAFFINIIANCLTGYIEGETEQYVILDIKSILCKYAKTWMITDLISSLSFFGRVLALQNFKLKVILLTLKILRLPTIYYYVSNILTVAKVGILTRTAVELNVLLVSYISINIYLQFAVEYLSEGTQHPTSPTACSWLSVAQLWNETSAIRFAYALDRAVSTLRGNANLNLVEVEDGCFETFFICAWVSGQFLVFHCAFKYMIALFGTESARAKYFMMAQEVEMYMNQRKFPPRIKEKILKFYAIRFQSHFFVESRMIACVSGQLKEDIIMHTGRQLVRDVEFLKQMPRSLLLQIGIKLKIVIYIAGDIIFKINTIGDCLYFIDKGTVAIYSEAGKEVCHLEDGDFFGEIALVMKNRLRTASAIAVTNCELFRLDRADFERSIACYPTVYEEIRKVATSRFEKTSVMNEFHKANIMDLEHADNNLSTADFNSRELLLM